MTDLNEELTNQTLFANEQPILQPEFSEPAAPVAELTSEMSKAEQQQKKLLIVGAAGGSIFLVLLLLLVLMKPKMQRMVFTPSPTPAASAQPLPNQFQARVNELNTDLENADPIKVNLSAPPLDLSLSLDPLPR